MNFKSKLCSLVTLILGIALWLLTTSQSIATAQEASNLLNNGSMENATDDNQPQGWVLQPVKGYTYSLVEDSFAGEKCLLIDSTNLQSSAKTMTAAGTQAVEAKSFAGKRIRLKAATKTDVLVGPARLHLFVKCSLPGEGMFASMTPKIRTLDEMPDRPIRNSQWQTHEIVVDVPKDAGSVSVGWKMVGRGRVWVDDLTLNEVGDDVALTTEVAEPSDDPMGDYAEILPLLRKAQAEAHLAPKQPFFNHWLWLAVFSLALFSIAMLPRKTESSDSSNLLEQDQPANPSLMFKFAFRFSVVYWILFLFTISVEGEFGKLAVWANQYYKPVSEFFINGLAEHVFKIEGELTPPLGSGDTTYSYIHVLARFLVSIVIAIAWSLLDWRKTDHRISRDLFNSYLRYTLAMTLMVYGLIKIQWSGNQFSEIYPWRLEKTWGETSPMGVVWNFMGASRPYTVFGGTGELVAGLLLVFRRTSILGALASIGVMSNVVMLNFCYDVPVKILSVHLLVIGFMLLIAYGGTLKSLLFLKPVRFQSLKPPYYSSATRWAYFPIKAALVIVGFGMPCWFHAATEIDYLSKQAALPKWLDEYSVAEFKIDGEPVSKETHPTRWDTANFSKTQRWSQVDEDANAILTLKSGTRQTAQVGFAGSSGDKHSFPQSEQPTIPQGPCTVTMIDEDTISLTGSTLAGEIEVLMNKNPDKETNLIYDRGFRWISEVPFNR